MDYLLTILDKFENHKQKERKQQEQAVFHSCTALVWKMT